jgi:hypothetical protein
VAVAVVLSSGVLGVACDQTNPSAPTQPASAQTSPRNPATTLSGRVTATNGGQALSGLKVSLNGQTTSTNADGKFVLDPVTTSSILLALSGNIVPREVWIAAGSGRDVAMDAIAQDGLFDLAFYRQMVRDGFERPSSLLPLRRWTVNPSIYLKTVDEEQAAIDAATLDMVESTVREMVPLWTAGRLAIATLERGTGTRAGVAGWITIKWPATVVNPNQCGRSDVAVSGGVVEIEAHNPRCMIGNWVNVPSLVRHEIGHAMGFWHTGAPTDVMSATTWVSVDQRPSSRELAAAAIAYRRVVGNTDPDSDPPYPAALTPLRAVP